MKMERFFSILDIRSSLNYMMLKMGKSSRQVVDTNGQGHGALSSFLTNAGVEVLICGGIGGGAQTALAAAGIQLFGSVSGNADEAVKNYIAGNLNYNPEVHCTHHEHEHSCGEHHCSEDKHGCNGNAGNC